MPSSIYTAAEVDLLLAPIHEHLAGQDQQIAALQQAKGGDLSSLVARVTALEAGGVGGGSAPDVYASIHMNWSTMAIGGPSQTFWYAARRAQIDNVRAGDPLLVMGRGQLTNNTAWNVEVAELLTLHTDPLESFYANTTPQYYGVNAVQPIIGKVITPGEHHASWHVHEALEAPADAAVLNVTYWLRCRSSAANGNNGVIVIDAHQARMHVVHWPGTT